MHADSEVSDPFSSGFSVSCFELSKDGKTWTKQPELLCVRTGDKKVVITLTTGTPMTTQVATFRVALKSRAKCSDCRKDEFAPVVVGKSVFSPLSIKFSGKRDLAARTEAGTVSIGTLRLHYRTYQASKPTSAGSNTVDPFSR